MNDVQKTETRGPHLYARDNGYDPVAPVGTPWHRRKVRFHGVPPGLDLALSRVTDCQQDFTCIASARTRLACAKDSDCAQDYCFGGSCYEDIGHCAAPPSLISKADARRGCSAPQGSAPGAPLARAFSIHRMEQPPATLRTILSRRGSHAQPAHSRSHE
jgi:hypothetical protein